MKPLIEGLRLVVSRNDSRRIVIIFTVLFFLLVLYVQNAKEAFELFALTSLSLSKRVSLFITIFFDIRSTFTTGALILAMLGSLLGGINIALAYTYMKIRGEVILKSGLYSGLGLIMAFFGIGCAACGTALLSVILGFFGFSATLNVLPYHGAEIGYIGLIFLSIATYTLAKKVTAPLVC